MKRIARTRTKGGITRSQLPIWMQGVHNGKPIRQSLGTRSMREAVRQVAALEDPHAPPTQAGGGSGGGVQKTHSDAGARDAAQVWQRAEILFCLLRRSKARLHGRSCGRGLGRLSRDAQARAANVRQGAYDLGAVLFVLRRSEVDRGEPGEEDQGATQHQAARNRSLHAERDYAHPGGLRRDRQ